MTLAHLMEKAMAPHSSTLAWKIPCTEEPGGLQSMGSLRVGHDLVTSLSLFTFMHWRRKWQPTPVFLPGESQGRRGLVGCHLWGRTESATRLSSSSSYLLKQPLIASLSCSMTVSLGQWICFLLGFTSPLGLALLTLFKNAAPWSYSLASLPASFFSTWLTITSQVIWFMFLIYCLSPAPLPTI